MTEIPFGLFQIVFCKVCRLNLDQLNVDYTLFVLIYGKVRKGDL